jgi:hypothetical protein
MKGILCSAVIFVTGLTAAPVLAETTSQTVYKYKHWEVEAVAFDDGSYACLAEVDDTTDSFTLWVYQDNTVKLQFYSTSWDFGEGDTADLQIKIGNRSPWSLNAAELYQNSILFDLPDSSQGVNFIKEVAQGSRLYLNTASGEPVMEYSLAGSKASIAALGECSDQL